MTSRGLFLAMTVTGLLVHTASPKPGAENIVGEWVRESTTPTFVFQENGTMHVEQGEKRLFAAKYRVDLSTTPHQVDFFDFDNREFTGGVNEMAGIFQLEGTQRLRMETGKGAARPSQFSDLAQSSTRVGTAPLAPSIIGEWKQDSAMVETYTFTADGIVRSHSQYRNDPPRDRQYRYSVEGNSSPRRINFYFEGIDDPSFRGIFDFDSKGRLKFEGRFTKDEAERPKNFGPEAELYVRRP